MKNINNMTADEIRQLLDRLKRDKDEITKQLEDARSAAAVDGVFSDREWFTSAKHAERIKGRQIGEVQIALGVALKEQRATASEAQSVRFEREFMRQARAILPRVLYEEVLNETVAATTNDSDPDPT